MFTSFSLMFIAATIALARSAGEAAVLQTRFVVSNAGPLTQSGNCIVHAGDASTAITAVDTIVRIFRPELKNCNWNWDLGSTWEGNLSEYARKVKWAASFTLYTIVISSKLRKRYFEYVQARSLMREVLRRKYWLKESRVYP
jgi:hypothetical protein